MKTNAEKDEKTCWACKRITAGEGKFGLCPDCLNKGGSIGISLGIAGLALLVKAISKNTDENE